MIRDLVPAIVFVFAALVLACAAVLLAWTAARAIPLGPGSTFVIGPSTQGVSSSPPATCSNKLDFSAACNSQYINVVGI